MKTKLKTIFKLNSLSYAVFKQPFHIQLPNRAPDVSRSIDIRESMASIGKQFPALVYRIIQQIITEITGKAPMQVEPFFEFTALHRQLMTLGGIMMSTGVIITGIYLWSVWIWPFSLLLIISGWLLMSASFRTMQVSFVHYASHGNLYENCCLNTVMAELYSIVALATPLWEYRPDHIGGHHSALNSDRDPDSAMLLSWGFESGKSVAFYWGHFWRMVFSPGFHGRMLISRLQKNFAPGLIYSKMKKRKASLPTRADIIIRQWCAIVFHLSLLVISITSSILPLYVLAYLVPLTVGYNLLTLCQVIGEHQPFIVPGQSTELRGDTRFTAGRFFGSAYRGNIRWWLHLVFVALPSKWLLVGPSELQSHDVHHDPDPAIWKISDKRWPMASYVRRDAQRDKGVVYKENWGIRTIFDHTFVALSMERTER